MSLERADWLDRSTRRFLRRARIAEQVRWLLTGLAWVALFAALAVPSIWYGIEREKRIWGDRPPPPMPGCR